MKKIKFSDSILWEDESLYVVDKPTGLSSLAEHNTEAASLIDKAKQYNPQSRLCHRLDKGTTGCLIIAKTDEAYRHIAIQFEKRRILKFYHAVIWGSVNYEEREVKIPLIKKQNNSAIWGVGGKPSLTYFNSLEIFRHFTLVECRPITGRYHQIRVHLAYLQTPIVADVLYGGSAPLLSPLLKKYRPSQREENPMIQRFALHAKRIAFQDLAGNEQMVESPYPSDIETLLKLIRKNDAL